VPHGGLHGVDAQARPSLHHVSGPLLSVLRTDLLGKTIIADTGFARV
jgi:hypothetical protein